MRRQRMSKKKSRRTFRRGANKSHSKNKMNTHYMRGGIRL